MLQPGRYWERGRSDSLGHRYGFNGMERDDDILESRQRVNEAKSGAGSALNFGARIYDSRTGRWFSRDPVFQADNSGYAAFRNNPIFWIDPTGMIEENPNQPDVEGSYEYEQKTVPMYSTLCGDCTKPIWVPTGNIYHNGKAISQEQYDISLQSYVDNFFDLDYNPESDGFNNGSETGEYFESRFLEIASQTYGGFDFVKIKSDGQEIDRISNPFRNKYYPGDDPMFHASEMFAGGRLIGAVGKKLSSYITRKLFIRTASERLNKGIIKYHPRIRVRGMQDPKAHNFPYSFDREIFKMKPTVQNDGSLLYKLEGTLNNNHGVFEIAVNPKTNVIFHRQFKPINN